MWFDDCKIYLGILDSFDLMVLEYDETPRLTKHDHERRMDIAERIRINEVLRNEIVKILK